MLISTSTVKANMLISISTAIHLNYYFLIFSIRVLWENTSTSGDVLGAAAGSSLYYVQIVEMALPPPLPQIIKAAGGETSSWNNSAEAFENLKFIHWWNS